VKFAISDTGIGIPPEKVNSLFQNFSQVKASDTRKYGGTGLGLSISKHLVELQGGKIEVESTVGRGTTFSFIINYPLGSADRLHQRISAEQNADGSVMNGLRMLIADDNEYNRLVINETLHLMADVHTDEVVNGQEALDIFMKNDYDLILMDVQMPVMNGIDATKEIRAHFPPGKKNIPIIAFTASVLRADLDLCFDAGMTAYVPKPFKAWQLINTICEVTGRERKTTNQNSAKQPQQAKPQPKAMAEAAQQIAPAETLATAEMTNVYVQGDKVTNLDYLTKFCEGDRKRMDKYIKVYLNALPAFHKNIEAAVATKDFTEIALHVHSFKPKWMMMGMKQTNELGIKIDQLCKAQNEKAFEDLKVLLDDINKSVKELETAAS
jgi:CheY-like chemotaxis protein